MPLTHCSTTYTPRSLRGRGLQSDSSQQSKVCQSTNRSSAYIVLYPKSAAAYQDMFRVLHSTTVAAMAPKTTQDAIRLVCRRNDEEGCDSARATALVCRTAASLALHCFSANGEIASCSVCCVAAAPERAARAAAQSGFCIWQEHIQINVVSGCGKRLQHGVVHCIDMRQQVCAVA